MIKLSEQQIAALQALGGGDLVASSGRTEGRYVNARTLTSLERLGLARAFVSARGSWKAMITPAGDE